MAIILLFLKVAFFLHKFVKLVLLFCIALFHLYIQLWDLTSGKLLHEFKQHTAAVNCVEFHPKEFLLATASNDRFVTFISFLNLSLQATRWIKCSFVHNHVQLGFLTGNWALLFPRFFHWPGILTKLYKNGPNFTTNFFSFFRTVKFWDLETFQLVSTTDAETNGIR